MTTAIIFDLGGVLIDWNPAYLYRKVFKDEVEINHFLEKICTSEWNEEQDAGRTLEEATETLIKEYPEHEENIRLLRPLGGNAWWRDKGDSCDT
jgi:2-haloacid dehalogenase